MAYIVLFHCSFNLYHGILKLTLAVVVGKFERNTFACSSFLVISRFHFLWLFILVILHVKVSTDVCLVFLIHHNSVLFLPLQIVLQCLIEAARVLDLTDISLKADG